jgi:hypothetical protein
VNLVARARRSVRIAVTAAAVYSLYKGPAGARRLLRRPPPVDDTATHRRAARLLLHTALALRGVSIKFCQVVATRADIFPPAMIDILKQCHDAVPPHPCDGCAGQRAGNRNLHGTGDPLRGRRARRNLAAAGRDAEPLEPDYRCQRHEQ